MAQNMTNLKNTIKTPYINEAQYITSKTQRKTHKGTSKNSIPSKSIFQKRKQIKDFFRQTKHERIQGL